MHSPRIFRLLLVVLSFFAVAQALGFDSGLFNRLNYDLVRRAKETGDSSAAAKPSGNDSPASSTPPTAQATSTPPKTTPTPTTSDTSTTNTTPTQPTSTPPTTTSTNSSPTNKQTSTSSPTGSPTGGTTTPPPTSTSTTPISTSTFVTTVTQPDGSTTAFTTEATTTPTASLSSPSGGSTSGMSTQTRNIIIGVVVGVGGAIILAVIALVAWRIWGRKKSVEERDELMDYGGGYNNPANPLEKPEGPAAPNVPGRSPFQSTLESYHAPTQVNTASNF